MKFLLDTCVLSEVRRPTPDPGVVQWLSHAAEERLYLSVVALMEIQKGISKLPEGARRTALQRWLDEDLPARFSGRIVSVDQETALAWGELLGEEAQKGSPAPLVDTLLAATAVVHNLTLVTRNTQDFGRLPVRLLNPWGTH